MDNIGVLIPSDRIARVIGKAGFGLKQIREITGVKVTVQESSGAEAEAEADPVPRRVDIVGNAEQMAMAFALVVNKAYAGGGPQTIEQQLLVPQDKAGSVVGKGGENLRRVREECRVRLALERDPVENAEKGIQERMVTMSGDAENMRHAIWYVLGLGCGPFAMMGGFGMMPGSPLALTAAGMSHVQPPGSDPEEVQVHMHVPDHLAGAILGKAGAQVKHTAAVAGCKVSVSARDVGAERRAVMIGSFGQVSTAQKMVAEQLLEASAAAGSEMREVSVVLMVRKEAAGVVIGKQGASLTEIREKTGSRIQLAREEVMGQRACNISGPIASILQAEELIFELVRQVPVAPQAPQPFGMGGFPGFGQDMPGMGPDGRPGSGNPEEISKLLVPAQSAGSVIGKQGSGLKQIREMCGVHVDIVQSVPEWPNDRVVTIKGTLTSRQQAVEMITRMAYQMSGDSSSLKLLVPAPQVGGVIGKQGSTLRAIREQCGVSTQVEREEVDGDRMVSVMGHHPQVAAAGRSILSVLAGAGPGGGGGSRPDSGPQGVAGGRGGPRQGQPQQGQQQGRVGQQRPPQQQQQQQQQQRPAPPRQMQQSQMQQPQMQQPQQQHPQLQQQQQPQQRQQQMQPQLQPGYAAALQQQMLQPQQQRPQQLQQLPQQYPFHPQPPSNVGYAAPAGYTMGATPWG